ncbi:ABC transporter G member 31 [Trebouxia sp. C0009 RCD-2024]
MRREVILVQRNSFLYVFKVAQIERTAVFFKQRDDLFFPVWSYVLPTSLMRLPVSLLESLIWVAIVYYPVGLSPNPDRETRRSKKLGNMSWQDTAGGKITGDIRINGHPKQQATFARVSGYVEQSDLHSPKTTVREALLFSASLRIDPSVPADRINAFVEEMLDLISDYFSVTARASQVGIPGVSGLSVEQRKRLTIAVELVANPSIVFMDEPTSGLDARAAAIVMRTVRNIANTGRTIVCTIHQPSVDIFESFDELLLLKRGGQTIYAGPLGKDSVDLVRYFEEVPGIDPMSITLNPATWMLEVTTPVVWALLQGTGG